MKEEIIQVVKEKLENKENTYITLEEIEETIDKKIEYIESVNIIKQLTNDGILKAIREE